MRELADGGTFYTIAGQPTDDSEMALLLARTLTTLGGYDPEEARKAYVFWLNSRPFDCGNTVTSGLRGHPNPDSQANGAMMRVSPLGILGVNFDPDQVEECARQDAALTHPHPVCRQANALFTLSMIALMEPPMIAVMKPVKSVKKAVSDSLSNQFFSPPF